MSSRPRVLPPTSTSGLSVLSIGLGLLFGVIATWICFWSEGAFSSSFRGGFGHWHFLIILTSFLLPAWLVGRLIARIHHRFLPNFLAALSYGPACIAGAGLVIMHWKASDLVTPLGQSPHLGMFLIALIGFGSLGAITSACMMAVVLAGYFTERFLGRRVIIQPGLTCWVCGYNLGARTITTCPECGVGFDPNQPPRSASYDFLGLLKRHRRWPIAIALLLAALPLAYSTATQTYPAIRFLSSCPAGGELRPVMSVNYIWLPSAGNGGSYSTARPLSQGWWIPDSLDPDTGFAVVYHPVAIAGQPRMFITRGYLTDPGAAVNSPQSRQWWMVYPGTENVVAKLNSAQASEVIRTRTIPAPLITALREKATRVNWSMQSGSSKWPSGEQSIDATPYFFANP